MKHAGAILLVVFLVIVFFILFIIAFQGQIGFTISWYWHATFSDRVVAALIDAGILIGVIVLMWYSSRS